MGKHKKKRKKTRRDTAEIARFVVEQAVGEPLTPPSDETIPSEDVPPEEDTRNPAAVVLGRLGASKGGKARAQKLSKKRRTDIAKRAARARWRKHKP